MLAEYTRRRDWILRELDNIPGFRCINPEGAFYAFPDVRGCLKGEVKTSGEFADRLLHEEQTVVTDGAVFGAEGFLRLSYATSLDRLQEGVRRIKRVAALWQVKMGDSVGLMSGPIIPSRQGRVIIARRFIAGIVKPKCQSRRDG